MFLSILPLLAISQVDASLDRMNQFFIQHPSFEVNLKATTSTGQTASGHLAEERPSKMAFTLSFPDTTYTMYCDGDRVLEASSAAKMYDDYVGNGKLWMPDAPFVVTDWRMVVPVPLFVMDFHRFFPNNAKFEMDAPSAIDGSQADVVKVTFSHGRARYTLRLYLTAEGRPIRQRFEPENGPWIQYELTDFKAKSFQASTFRLRTTPGWRAYELPWAPSPLRMDQKLPSARIVQGATSSKVSLALAVGAPGLLAVVDPAWSSSATGKEALGKVTAMLKKYGGGKAVLLSDQVGKNPRGSMYYDPTGEALKILHAPGTPVFFVINREGKIERLFMGYDPRDRHFLPELKQAITQPGSSREYPPTESGD